MKHRIYLLTYIPGNMMYNVPQTPSLLYKTGAYLARLDKELIVRITTCAIIFCLQLFSFKSLITEQYTLVGQYDFVEIIEQVPTFIY